MRTIRMACNIRYPAMNRGNVNYLSRDPAGIALDGKQVRGPNMTPEQCRGLPANNEIVATLFVGRNGKYLGVNGVKNRDGSCTINFCEFHNLFSDWDNRAGQQRFVGKIRTPAPSKRQAYERSVYRPFLGLSALDENQGFTPGC